MSRIWLDLQSVGRIISLVYYYIYEGKFDITSIFLGESDVLNYALRSCSQTMQSTVVAKLVFLFIDFFFDWRTPRETPEA